MKKAHKWMIGLMLLSVVTAGVFVTLAPDIIPVHYNAAGEIDRWGSKYEFLLFPFFTVLMGAFMALVGRHERKKGDTANETVVLAVGIWVLVLFNALWMFFYGKTLAGTELSGSGDLSIKGIFVLIAASFVPLGNRMPKARRNSFYGLRTKWSVADDVCWQKSQRLGGYTMVGTGILGIALISLVPATRAPFVLVGLAMVVAVADTAGTYYIWKKEQEKSTA